VTGRGYDILLTKSTNGGTTWSTPLTLNSDTGSADQFHPTLSVASNGAGGDTVTVTFYDRRDDGANCPPRHATQSTDGVIGRRRAEHRRVELQRQPGQPGDYCQDRRSPQVARSPPFGPPADFEIYAYRGQ
jgi:hypothetical protein